MAAHAPIRMKVPWWTNRKTQAILLPLLLTVFPETVRPTYGQVCPETTTTANKQGRWTCTFDLESRAVHATLLRGDGGAAAHSYLFYWPEEAEGEGGGSGPGRVWKWKNGDTTPEGLISIPMPANLFCAGHSVLPDGRLFVTGGTDMGNDVGIRCINVFNIQKFKGASGAGIEFAEMDSTDVSIVDLAASPADTTLILDCLNGIHVKNYSRPKIRKARVTNCTNAFRVKPMAVPDLGTNEDFGNNDVSSTKLINSDIRYSGYPEIYALLNWWGTDQSSSIAAKMTGPSNWNPFLMGDPLPTLSRPGIEVGAVAEVRAWAQPNTPNPFRDRTMIRFQVAIPDQRVEVEVYTVGGRRVLRHGGDYGPGVHDWVWDGRDDHGRLLSSGIYLYRLTIGVELVKSGRMLIIR